jgi:hypothetical protein
VGGSGRLQDLPEGCVRDRGHVEGATPVRCEFDWHVLGSDRLGQHSYEGGELGVFVRGGRIVGANLREPGWDLWGLRGDVWGQFASFDSWLEREHPGDAVQMLLPHDKNNPARVPIYTDASLVLWDRYVDEWVASQR